MTTINGFPLDSVVTGIAQNGLPEYSNKYHSVDYRRVINSLVSDGVIANIGQSLRVRVKPGDSATGEIAHFQVQTGTAVLQGVFAHVDDNLDFTISAPFVSLDYSLATQNYFVGIRVNTIENKDTYESAEVVSISGSIKNGSSTAVDPAVGSNFLVLARVVAKTVKNSNGSYTYSYTLQDTRASNLCGWSTPFAEIDTSAYYAKVEEAVDGADEAIDKEIARLQNKTQNAIDLTQSALDETTAGYLSGRIDDVESGEAIENGAIGKDKLSADVVDSMTTKQLFLNTDNAIWGTATFSVPTGGCNLFTIEYIDWGHAQSPRSAVTLTVPANGNLLFNSTDGRWRIIKATNDGENMTFTPLTDSGATDIKKLRILRILGRKMQLVTS